MGGTGETSARSTVAQATSLIDETTLIASPLGWERELEAATARLSEYWTPAAVASIDLDRAVDGGPEVLADTGTVRVTARALAWVTRDDDVAARIEGGRFALLVLGTAAEEPRELRRRVLEALSSVGVEGSVSISTARPGEDLTAVWERARRSARGRTRRAAEKVTVTSAVAEAAQELHLLLVEAGAAAAPGRD